MQWKLAEEDAYQEALRGWLADVASSESVRQWLDDGDPAAFEERFVSGGRPLSACPRSWGSGWRCGRAGADRREAPPGGRAELRVARDRALRAGADRPARPRRGRPRWLSPGAARGGRGPGGGAGQQRRLGRRHAVRAHRGVGSSLEAVYSGAEGGIIAFTETLAREVATKGVIAHTVCPGPPTPRPFLHRQLRRRRREGPRRHDPRRPDEAPRHPRGHRRGRRVPRLRPAPASSPARRSRSRAG